MLRKRSRSFQKDQYKDHLMPGSASESCFQTDILGEKHRSSIFSVPGLFVGFSTNGVSDSDSARSPTSPLDYRVFTHLGNPSPRSCLDGSQKSWDCSKVGLRIVDSLSDENKPSGKVLGLSESRNILFGSQIRINIPSSPSYLYRTIDSSETPKSLPKNYAISPHTHVNSSRLQLCSSEIAFGTGEIQLQPKPLEKIRSCLSDSGWSMSPLTGLTDRNLNSKSENFSSGDKTKEGSPPLIGGGPNLDNFVGVKPCSLPISIGSGHGLMGSLSASEIELSEDYTCIISHGPNPRTTHIFGDCILECHKNELANCSNKEEQGIESPQVVKCSNGSPPYPSNGFLSFCYFCRKKLEEGKDIFMYRGEKAFCSCNCRTQEILVEEEMEKPVNNFSNSSPKSTSSDDIFLMGMVVAT